MTKRRFKPTNLRLVGLSVAAVAVLIVGALAANYFLGLRPAASSGEPQEFAVAAGENAPQIAKRLAAAGLIRDRNSFVTYVNLNGLRPRLKAGTYRISPTWPASDIAQLLAGGHTTSKRLIVPEGYTLRQITKAAVAAGVSEADFKAALAAPHTQAFLAGKPANVSLEGYLYPDSYQVDDATTAASLVDAMLNNFAARVGPEYIQAFAAQGLNLHQALTLASMVEREVNIAADRPIVAQIFLKRLRAGQSLGSDVTTVYAAELLGKPFDVNLDSPYNTRRYAGLPPGPIANPGRGALDAVAKPATTDYLFFLTGRDGKTYYAKTYPEHQQNITKYLE